MFPVFITYLMSMNKTNTTKENENKIGQKCIQMKNNRTEK